MSKGFLIFAQNTSDDDYVQQAYALALSIKSSQTEVTNISLVTDDEVPAEYKSVFDKIIPIPFGNSANDESMFKAENRWKLYHASPYNETIVLDTDMLLLEDISSWWKYCSNFDIKFCSGIKNYKNESVVDTFHRKAFIANNLPSPYFALHYFKKSVAAHEFYKVLEFVVNNWEWCWTKFASEEYQNWLSMDLATAIAIEIVGGTETMLDTTNTLTFTHMKTPLQGWQTSASSWKEQVSYNFDKELVVSNIKQHKLFHYVEKDFLTPSIIKQLKALVNG